jgi:hypothetical protein
MVSSRFGEILFGESRFGENLFGEIRFGEKPIRRKTDSAKN